MSKKKCLGDNNGSKFSSSEDWTADCFWYIRVNGGVQTFRSEIKRLAKLSFLLANLTSQGRPHSETKIFSYQDWLEPGRSYSLICSMQMVNGSISRLRDEQNT